MICTWLSLIKPTWAVFIESTYNHIVSPRESLKHFYGRNRARLSVTDRQQVSATWPWTLAAESPGEAMTALSCVSTPTPPKSSARLLTPQERESPAGLWSPPPPPRAAPPETPQDGPASPHVPHQRRLSRSPRSRTRSSKCLTCVSGHMDTASALVSQTEQPARVQQMFGRRSLSQR